MNTAQVLVKDIKDILTGTTSSKDQLIKSAENSVTTMTKLCEEVKTGAASLTSENQQAQVGSYVDIIHVSNIILGDAFEYYERCFCFIRRSYCQL